MSTVRRAAWLAAVVALWAIKACAGITQGPNPCVDMLTYEIRSCVEPATEDGRRDVQP